MKRETNRPWEQTPGAGKAAVYTKQLAAADNENPLICALPLLPSGPERASQIIQFLSTLPYAVAPSDRAKSDFERLEMVAQLDSVFVPLPRHVELFTDIYIQIRNGYRRRTMPTYWASSGLAGFAGRNGADAALSGGDKTIQKAAAMTVLGLSGLGKSAAIRKCLSFFPEIIRHDDYGFYQIPSVCIDCPPSASIKQIASSIINEISDITGIDLIGSLKRLTTNDIVDVASKLLAFYNVGLLVLDECQELVHYREGEKSILRGLVQLANRTKVPIIFVGTPDAAALFRRSLAQCRRAGPSVSWYPLEQHPSPKSEFSYFADVAWQFLYLRTESPLTPSIKDVWYSSSQGVPAFIMQSFCLVQSAAISRGYEKITAAFFREVVGSKMAIQLPVINALRSSAQSASPYSDLYDSRLYRRPAHPGNK